MSLDRSATWSQEQAAIRQLIESRVRRQALVPVELEGAGKQEHWARPDVIERSVVAPRQRSLFSPFDPLIIQRKRTDFLRLRHRFEAYVQGEAGVGHFALPVLSATTLSPRSI